jgi:hypothetical protein
MAINPILNIQTSPDYHVFEFDSDGRQRLRKRVQFDLIDASEHIYNLSLCTVLPDGNLDCKSDTKDGDMDRVLETTAHIGILYINQFPERKVFLQGSDAKRSRKYQMGINRYLMELSKKYFIEGVAIANDIITSREGIRAGKNYQAFIFSILKK